MHGLAVCVKEGLPFALDLSPENSRFLPMFSASFPSLCLTSFSSIDLLCCYVWFLILFHLTQMRFSQLTHLLMCLSLETIINIYHKDWLTYSGGTDRPGELCYNFLISSDLTQMVNFPTCILDCDSHSPALLDLFLLTLAFVLQWLSLHWEILICSCLSFH